MRIFLRIVALTGSLIALGACSTTNAAHDGDPLYSWNKSMHAFNKGADTVLIKPVAQGYRAVVPKPGRDGLRNVLDNLRSPIIFGNDVLQGKFDRAGTTLQRFVLNTTIGIFGLFDVAKRGGIEKHNEDMGQTLASWGVDSGPYLVLPLLGPSSLRDATGFVLDFGLEPLTYSRFKGRQALLIGRTGLAGLSLREENLEVIDDLRATSIDEYASIKSAYEQFRANEIADGEVQIDDLPDFDEFEDE